MTPLASRLAWTLTLVSLGTLALADEPPGGVPSGDRPELTAVPGTKARLVKPEGFEIARQFPGFGQPEMGASVMVTEIPGPYAEITAGFTQEDRLAAAGMTLRSREDVQLSGKPGLLLHLTQRAGPITVEKWIGVVGDEEETIMVVTNVPAEFAADLSGPLKAAVLSLQWDRDRPVDPFADLAYTVEPPRSLRYASRIGNTLMYTSDGMFPKTDPAEPLFVVGQAVSDVVIADPAEYAAGRVRQTATVDGIEVESNEPIQVEGLEGREIVASARSAKEGPPVVVYQAMLFEGNSYYLLQGIAGAERRDEILPDFRAMARSFRMKADGEPTP